VDINSKSNSNFIPHSRPTLGEEEARAASAVIESGYIAEGRVVKEFESDFARRLGIDHAVATSSGTAALHLCLLALGIGSGDEVIMPAYVCTALLNAVNYVGASPVIAEIDPQTHNIDPGDVKNRLTGRTRAIIVPHLFGLPADLDSLLSLEVPIIEDCAQSVGGLIDERPLGTLGDVAIFSFYATKMMACGEGGMVVSRSAKISSRINDLKTYDERQHYETRFNYKMTDIQAAIGRVQLKRLGTFIRQRRQIAHRYCKALSFPGLKLPSNDPAHIYYRFVIGLESDSQAVIGELNDKGIGCNRPIHTPLHHCLNLCGYPVTDHTWETSLSIPIYPSLSDEDVERVIEVVTDTLMSCRT
jgi:dTDP-4-amino-4,6-dideoxygalactose transaminase